MAEAYHRMTAETNRGPIGRMLEHANALWPLGEAIGILDDGCGPGPIMARIIDEYGGAVPPSCTLACTDLSDGMVEWVRKRKDEAVRVDRDSVWQRVECFKQDAMDLERVGDESLSHVFAGWVREVPSLILKG